MCLLYKHFANNESLDFSKDAKKELYKAETFGKGNPHYRNGYAIGKKWLNVQVEMWFEDIAAGMLYIEELYNDPNYPKWWLDKILKKTKQGHCEVFVKNKLINVLKRGQK